MHGWEKVLISEDMTIEAAIDILQLGSLQIVLIVDEKRKLLGTVTDGDIRRGLIKHISLQANIKEVMNSKPRVASTYEDKDKLLQIMEDKKILQIPLVNEDKCVVGLETLHNLLTKKEFANPVVLMAGGLGTRLLPLTQNTPKPMLTLGNEPLLENILKAFIQYGFSNFYISVCHLSDHITDYFGDGAKWGVKISYLYEKSPLGTVGALGLISENVEQPVIVMNCDILTKVNFSHLLQFHEQAENCAATVCVRRYDFQVPYGVVESENDQVTNIVEKPKHSFFVNAGIYILNAEIIKHIPKNSHLDMTDLLKKLVDRNHKVSMFPIHEYWLDVGMKDSFKKAQYDFKNFFDSVENNS